MVIFNYNSSGFTMELKSIDSLNQLSRSEFIERYFMKKPVIVRNNQIPQWNLQHLISKAGDAEVNVNMYDKEPSDYARVSLLSMTLKAFCQHLVARNVLRARGGSKQKPIYLFNDPSCVMAHNKKQPEFHVGWGQQVNEKLTPLWDDITIPNFIDENSFAFAMLILGSSENATQYHYDWGGNAKCIIQISGRKQVRLFAPSEAHHFNLYSAFSTNKQIKNQTTGRLSIEASNAHGFEALLEPGDVLYWPSFWFHEVQNKGSDINAAVGLSIAEIQMNPIYMRHLSHELLRHLSCIMMQGLEPPSQTNASFKDFAKDVKLSKSNQSITLLDLFQEYEKHLLSDKAHELTHLLQWNDFSSILENEPAMEAEV